MIRKIYLIILILLVNICFVYSQISFESGYKDDGVFIESSLNIFESVTIIKSIKFIYRLDNSIQYKDEDDFSIYTSIMFPITGDNNFDQIIDEFIISFGYSTEYNLIGRLKVKENYSDNIYSGQAVDFNNKYAIYSIFIGWKF